MTCSKQVTLSCDKCSANTGEIPYSTATEALSNLDGWAYENGNHYCPDCTASSSNSTEQKSGLAVKATAGVLTVGYLYYTWPVFVAIFTLGMAGSVSRLVPGALFSVALVAVYSYAEVGAFS
jgi:hypothetical protein